MSKDQDDKIQFYCVQKQFLCLGNNLFLAPTQTKKEIVCDCKQFPTGRGGGRGAKFETEAYGAGRGLTTVVKSLWPHGGDLATVAKSVWVCGKIWPPWPTPGGMRPNLATVAKFGGTAAKFGHRGQIWRARFDHRGQIKTPATASLTTVVKYQMGCGEHEYQIAVAAGVDLATVVNHSGAKNKIENQKTKKETGRQSQ